MHSDGKEAIKGVSRLRFEPIPMRRATDVVDAGDETTLARKAAEALKLEMQAMRQQHAAELDIARSEARREAQSEHETELERLVAVERERVVQTCMQFLEQREAYFAAVESEVVKLALAIAARVLHREVYLDPMLLRAAAKVALGKVAEQSGTVLRVPMQQIADWQSWVRAEELATETEVVGDGRLGAGECVLETRIGKVELGVSAQLEEIEKGFFDLLQQRPA